MEARLVFVRQRTGGILLLGLVSVMLGALALYLYLTKHPHTDRLLHWRLFS